MICNSPLITLQDLDHGVLADHLLRDTPFSGDLDWDTARPHAKLRKNAASVYVA